VRETFFVQLIGQVGLIAPTVETQLGIFARVPVSEIYVWELFQDVTDSESAINSRVARESE